MIAAAAYAIAVLALVICIAYGSRVLPGHERAGCLRRSLGIRALIAATLACVAVVQCWKHPVPERTRHP